MFVLIDELLPTIGLDPSSAAMSDAVRLGPTQQVEAAQRERSPCRPTGRQDNSADKTMESVN